MTSHRARGEAVVAQRQWTAYRFAEQLSAEVPRTRQVSDHDVYKWHNDAIRSGSLRHFVDLLKVRNAATCKMETTAVLSDGIHLTLDKKDTAPTRALVANCLLNADMLLTGVMAAWTIRIPTAAEGGPAGSDGFLTRGLVLLQGAELTEHLVSLANWWWV